VKFIPFAHAPARVKELFSIHIKYTAGFSIRLHVERNPGSCLKRIGLILVQLKPRDIREGKYQLVYLRAWAVSLLRTFRPFSVTLFGNLVSSGDT
jgi:hypothetical protein